MHVVFFNGARCLHLTAAHPIQRLEVGSCNALDASVIDRPKSTFADRCARPLPIAKLVKRRRYHQTRGGAYSPNGEISPRGQM